MQAWESIQQTVDYIEQHLQEELRIENLAEDAGLSQFYFQRLFSKLVGKPIKEYIRLRRLANASMHMFEHKEKIIDTAMNFGFENHETFTRAFKETYGMTPEQYRKEPVILNHFTKPDVSLKYVMIDENVPLVCDDMVLEVFFRDVKKPRYFAGLEKEMTIAELMGQETGAANGPKIWKELHARKKDLDLKANGNELGALYIGDAKEGNCKYLAAAEIEHPQHLPDDLHLFELVEGRYLITAFEAETEAELYGNAVFKADQYTQKWIAHKQLEMSDFGIEMYYRNAKVPYLEHWGKLK